MPPFAATRDTQFSLNQFAHTQNNARSSHRGRVFSFVRKAYRGSYFFAAFTLAQRARCAAAILLRAAADIVRFGAAAPFRPVPLLARTLAQRALCAAPILARAAAESLPLVPVCLPYVLPNAASAALIP